MLQTRVSKPSSPKTSQKGKNFPHQRQENHDWASRLDAMEIVGILLKWNSFTLLFSVYYGHEYGLRDQEKKNDNRY